MDKIKADDLREILEQFPGLIKDAQALKERIKREGGISVIDLLLWQKQGDSVPIVDEITATIKEYYANLDQRKNGDSAMIEAFEKIQELLCVHWIAGASLKAQKSPD